MPPKYIRVANEADNAPLTAVDSATAKRFFMKCDAINSGADGVVTRYVDRRNPSRVIAVKTPSQYGNTFLQNTVIDEIAFMNSLGKCDQIVSFLGFDHGFNAYGPAIFYEFCGMGDVAMYAKTLRDTYGSVPEETVWKFFGDMAKGLHYIHCELPTPLIHGDFKPLNILVALPPGTGSDEVPTLPNFKICDFGRAKHYDPTDRNGPRYAGTYEYAPPPAEQLNPQTPAVDVWSLGASLQEFALGVLPIQSTRTFCEAYKRRWGPDLWTIVQKGGVNLLDPRWRKNIPVVYRPLNADAGEQHSKWDWPSEAELEPPQYSDALEAWYRTCMQENLGQRLTAEYLKDEVAPIAARKIQVLEAQREVEEAKKRVEEARKARYMKGKQGNQRLPSPPDFPSHSPLLHASSRPLPETPARRPQGRQEHSNSTSPTPSPPARNRFRPRRVQQSEEIYLPFAYRPAEPPQQQAAPQPEAQQNFLIQGSPVLARQDFGLPVRPPQAAHFGHRIRRPSETDSVMARKEQKYLRGMKKP